MILTVGGIKGGVGKSLISIHLIVLRAMQGKKVLFVDADEQGTSSDWVKHRISLDINTQWTTIKLSGNAIHSELRKMKNDYDDIIIDCGGRDTSSLRNALVISDKILVPFQPKSFDIWTLSEIANLIKEAQIFNHNLKAFTFINCAASRGAENKDAQTILSDAEKLTLIPAIVGLRKAFYNATAEGKTVVEMSNDPKAIEEIKELYKYVFDIE